MTTTQLNLIIMKKHIIYLLAVVAGLAYSTTSCNKFDYSTPDTEHDIYTQDVEATGCTTTLAELKQKYRSTLSAQNGFIKIDEDIIFDGYVCANDITGNLYQSIYVRKIDDQGDNTIVVGVNDNSLWTSYPVGTHIKINLNGLYLGTYSYVPKIGMPYITSSGNTRLGGMAKFLTEENIEIIGFNANAPETVPIDIDATWLAQNQTDPTFMYKWAPTLVRVKHAEITGNFDAAVSSERQGQCLTPKLPWSGSWPSTMSRCMAPSAQPTLCLSMCLSAMWMSWLFCHAIQTGSSHFVTTKT